MPIPTYHYYVDGAKPIYKNFFNQFNNPEKKIYVLDLLKHIKKMKFTKRKSLSFNYDKSHFSQMGHKVISDFLTREISDLKITPTFRKVSNSITDNQNKKKSNYILGISAFYHDSAATLIKDGEIIAAVQEERFSRIKNDRRFPASAINYCLEKGEIKQNELLYQY